MSIHPTAIVDANASIGRDVQIGAYSVVGSNVSLGDRCRLHHHAIIEGHTTLGADCEVFPQAILGMPPQDLKFQGEKTTLEIGAGNTFREMVTVHAGTANGGGVTRIGEGNLFLIGMHIAHDCLIGNHCIIANYVQFAGHVHVEDNVNVGGHAGVHHFVTIGKHAFIGGMTRVVADAPPFMVIVAARGTRSEIRMINGVGLQRCGLANDDIAALKSAFMKLFSRRARMEGTAIRDRVNDILATENLNTHVGYLCNFLMRSFGHGRHGRYLESLRNDKVHRNTWKPAADHELLIDIVGEGSVDKIRSPNSAAAHEVLKLTASPESGWSFGGWNGCLSGQGNPINVVLDSDKTVTATFTPIQST